MKLFSDPNDLISQGLCPKCNTQLRSYAKQFYIPLTKISSQNQTLFNYEAMGENDITQCLSGHIFITGVRWTGLAFPCPQCSKAMELAANVLVCSSCRNTIDLNFVENYWQEAVFEAIRCIGIQPHDTEVTSPMNWNEERLKWNRAIQGNLNTVNNTSNFKQEQSISRQPNPSDAVVHQLIERYPTPLSAHPQGKYKYIGLLAVGGLSRIYLAVNWYDQNVVIKVPWGYKNEFEKGHEKRINPYVIAEEKLATESTFLKKIGRTKNIVEFIEEYNYDGVLHMVIEYLPGPSLRKYVDDITKTGARLPYQEALDYINQVIDSIRYIHERMNMVHRDITPNNYIIWKGKVTMLDFGTITVDTGLAGADKTGIQAGGYHSPEQAQGVSTKVCDIYSIGSTMYFLLTGKEPKEPTPNMPTEKVMLHELKRAAVPEALVSIVMKARAFSPAARYQTVIELKKAMVEYEHPDKRICPGCNGLTSKIAVICSSCNDLICSKCGAIVQNRKTNWCPSCSSTICPKCNHANEISANYCKTCGRALAIRQVCSSCRKILSYNAQFCRFCGNKTIGINANP